MSLFDKASQRMSELDAHRPELIRQRVVNDLLPERHDREIANIRSERRQQQREENPGFLDTLSGNTWGEGKARDTSVHSQPVDTLLGNTWGSPVETGEIHDVPFVSSLLHKGRGLSRFGETGHDSDINSGYEQAFLDSGMTQDEIDAIYEEQSGPLPRFLDTLSGNTWGENQVDVANQYSLDDGVHFNSDSLTSDYMTGSRYLYYRDELGMGGRDGWIDPNAIYSKTDEMNEYGFTPYTPTTWSAVRGGLSDAWTAIGNAATTFGTTRQDIANAINPYDIKMDGRDINGWTWLNESGDYMAYMSHEFEHNPSQFMHRPADRSLPYTTFVMSWDIVGNDGRTTTHYGDFWFDYNGVMHFDDGTSVEPSMSWLESVDYKVTPTMAPYEGTENLDYLNANADPSDSSTWSVIYIPDLVLSDGERINYFDCVRLDDDMYAQSVGEGEDPGISYDFGPGGLARPMSYTNMELFDEDKNGNPLFASSALSMMNPVNWLDLNTESIPHTLNNLIDLTAGSAPIMVPGVDWLSSLSNAGAALYGIDPSSYNRHTGHYGRLAAGEYDDDGNIYFGASHAPGGPVDEGYTNDIRVSNVLGTALVPLTERIAGFRGFGGDDLLELSKPIHQVAHEEGGEEIIGNVFENWQRNGLSGWYAEPYVYDDSDPEAYDPTGRRYVRTTTPVGNRAANFFNPSELINAYLGGAGIAGFLRANEIPGAVADAARSGYSRISPHLPGKGNNRERTVVNPSFFVDHMDELQRDDQGTIDIEESYMADRRRHGEH